MQGLGSNLWLCVLSESRSGSLVIRRTVHKSHIFTSTIVTIVVRRMTLRAFVSLSWQQRCNSGLSNQLGG
jgi:hypothetical protein